MKRALFPFTPEPATWALIPEELGMGGAAENSVSDETRTRLHGAAWVDHVNECLSRQAGYRSDMRFSLGGLIGGGLNCHSRDHPMAEDDKLVFETAHREALKTHYFLPATFTEFRPAVYHFSRGVIDYRCRYAPFHPIATSGEARPTEHFWTIALGDDKDYRGPDWNGHELETDAAREAFEDAVVTRVQNQGSPG